MSFFPDIAKIKYEGPESKNPLAFRHYNPDEVVEGKSMRDHLRFAVCYWHTFRGMGGDPFGPGCAIRPWEDGTDSLEMALKRVDVAFEFMEKLGVPYYCFHDRDVAPEGPNLAKTNENLDAVVKNSRSNSRRPASSSCGAPRTSSATSGSSTEPAQAATRTCSLTPARR